VDGVVALPATADTREQLEWLAEDVVEAGGEATIWLADPATAAEHRRLAASMTERIEEEYHTITTEARATIGRPAAEWRRTLARLRRELRRVGSRQYFPTDHADLARAEVEALAEAVAAKAAA
jgi:hypothetical protein